MRQRTLSVASAQLRAVILELKKDLRAPYWEGRSRNVN
jgi:hypothetical protein